VARMAVWPSRSKADGKAAGRSARRPGDSPVLVANNEMAQDELDWQPQFSLEEIARSAWRWHTAQNMSG